MAPDARAALEYSFWPMKLVIGNKNYSSWSLRPWLLLRQAGIAFDEELLSFNDPNFSARARRYSPTGRVPVLVDDDLAVWDSLAIAEYVAEKFADKRLWPTDRAARALARSVCAEMHAGFAHVRNRMPMNCELSLALGPVEVAVQKDIDRILAIWTDCRARYGSGGSFLFGHFTVADAYYAPLVLRFVSYVTPLPAVAQAYVETMMALAAMKEWLEAARAENEYVAVDEPYRASR